MQAKCYIIDTRIIRKQTQKTLLRAAGLSVVIMVGLQTDVLAATGIDAGAEKIYKKLLNVGKWVIIIKGAIDTIKAVADGDMGSARKNALGYGMTYMILHALPWGMNEIDKLFEDLA